MFRRGLGPLALTLSAWGLVHCGQDYNSNSNDNAGVMNIDCAIKPELCAAYVAMFKNHCFECHAWSEYYTDDDWINAGLVIRGSPDTSILVRRLKNAGSDMPRNYNPLTASEYNAVRTWIQNL